MSNAIVCVIRFLFFRIFILFCKYWTNDSEIGAKMLYFRYNFGVPLWNVKHDRA